MINAKKRIIRKKWEMIQRIYFFNKQRKMKVSVLGSSSKGNGYLLHSDNEALIIECGVRFAEVKKLLDYNTYNCWLPGNT